ncbi:AAA family ATPase [Conexivisphaera calida]|uniref:Cytidylate kinase n=1 Tax=Conexivisphaera calida TaxID=1874277 RepID=A0A4P2VB39_9ARCH|nr:cytidylate kinase family protein [Conexivisphaera calida]BBE41724.1 Cytidylate kinase [Conexivisphaera calida]
MRYVRSVVIAGMPASGKTTVARMVASRLNLNYVAGGDILREIARERGYRPEGDGWWDSDEGRRFLMERKGNPEFDREVDRRLKELILSGGYVATSYSMPWLLGPEVLKVWLNASPSARAARMAKRDGIPVEDARRIIEFRDGENAQLYRALYGYELAPDASVFHLIIDTESVPPVDVAELIALYARALWGASSETF